MKEKTKRIFTGIIYFAVILSAIIINKYEYILSLIFIQSVIGLTEYFNTIDAKDKYFLKYLGYFLSLLYLLSGIIFKSTQIYVKEIIFLGFLFSSIYTVIKFKSISIKEFAVINLGYIYIPFMLSFIPEIFNMQSGNILYMFLMFTIMSTDTFAYIFGMKFGKNKLTKLSPKKSVEGSVSGTISSVIVVAAMHTLLLKKQIICPCLMNSYLLLGATLIISIISQFGDLIASYIKRAYNKKDYGKILIGHGGILDRIDSLILSAPVAYMLFKYILI